MRWIVVLMLLCFMGATAMAQTETPTPTATFTPTPTNTPTPEPWTNFTLEPEASGTPGQMVRIEYIVSAGQTYISILLITILLSGWAMFLFFVIVRRR